MFIYECDCGEVIINPEEKCSCSNYAIGINPYDTMTLKYCIVVVSKTTGKIIRRYE